MSKAVSKFKIITKKISEGVQVKQPDGSFAPGKVAGLEAIPLTNGSAENELIFAATPAGHLGLGSVRVEAFSDFNEGDVITITIEKTPTA